MSIEDKLTEAVKIDYSTITPEILSEAMGDIDREITKQRDTFVMYTGTTGLEAFNRLMRHHQLVETLKKL